MKPPTLIAIVLNLLGHKLLVQVGVVAVGLDVEHGLTLGHVVNQSEIRQSLDREGLVSDLDHTHSEIR